MPKFHVFSDLHLPVNHGAPPVYVPEEVDAVIIAGDIAAPVGKSMSWLSAEVAAQGKPVIFVAGNHEHYGQVFGSSMASGHVSKRHIQMSIGWRMRSLSSEERAFLGARFGPTMPCFTPLKSPWWQPRLGSTIIERSDH